MNTGHRPGLRWLLAAAGALALAAAIAWNEHRENQRFVELNRRLDEMRLLIQSHPAGNLDLHVAAPVADEALAEKVATRVLASIAGETADAPARAEESDEQPATPPPRTTEQTRLLLQANELVDRAIRGGRLARTDVQELRNVFSKINDAPEQGELRTRVIRAINDQKLIPEDPATIMF